MTYGLVGFFAFMETVLGPIMPFLRRELDLGYAAASLHFSAFALGAVLLGFFGDRIVGRWGRRAALWGGAFGMAAGAVFLISSASIIGTVPAAFAMGVYGALVLVTSQAVLSDRHGEWSAVALTESNVTASACAIAAPLLVGATAASGLGWRAALVLPAVALVQLAARFFSRPLDLPPNAADDDAPADGPTLPPLYWTFWVLVALGVASEWCIGYWGADFLADGTGLARPRQPPLPPSSPRCSWAGSRAAGSRVLCPRPSSSPRPSLWRSSGSHCSGSRRAPPSPWPASS